MQRYRRVQRRRLRSKLRDSWRQQLARAWLARRVQDTQFKLEASGMKAASLHGEMSKMERQQVLAKFRAGGYRAMVRVGPEAAS